MEKTFQFNLNLENKSKEFILEYPYTTIRITGIALTNDAQDPVLLNDTLTNLFVEVEACDSITSLKEAKSISLSSIIQHSNATAKDFELNLPSQNIYSNDNDSMVFDSLKISIPDDCQIEEHIQLIFTYELSPLTNQNDLPFLPKLNQA